MNGSLLIASCLSIVVHDFRYSAIKAVCITIAWGFGSSDSSHPPPGASYDLKISGSSHLRAAVSCYIFDFAYMEVLVFGRPAPVTQR